MKLSPVVFHHYMFRIGGSVKKSFSDEPHPHSDPTLFHTPLTDKNVLRPLTFSFSSSGGGSSFLEGPEPHLRVLGKKCLCGFFTSVSGGLKGPVLEGREDTRTTGTPQDESRSPVGAGLGQMESCVLSGPVLEGRREDTTTGMPQDESRPRPVGAELWDKWGNHA